MANERNPLEENVSASVNYVRTRGAVLAVLAFVSGAAFLPSFDIPSRALNAMPAMSLYEQQFWVEELQAGLKFPWAMVWLPNGDQLITERGGTLRKVSEGKLLSTPLTGVPKVFANHVDGLLDISLDPDFQKNQLVYLALTEGDYDTRHAAVYRGRYTGSGLENVERIFRSKDDIRGVGPIACRMTFLPDKTLLVAVPESHAYRHLAQRMDSDIGKLVRINRDGSIPADNPFIKTPGALPEIYSMGHRNQSGIYHEPDTDRAWVLDIGPFGGDELNILKPGANYGWPKVSWGFDYSGKPISDRQHDADSEDPILVWSPSVAPSGITEYRGSRFPAWRGDLFVGNLAGKSLRRIRIKDGSAILDEKLLTALSERIRSVYVGPDGFIYLLTDHVNGRILRLRPGAPRGKELAHVARKQEATPAPAVWVDAGGMATSDFEDGDPVKGKKLFTQYCTGCHSAKGSIEGGEIGPDLRGVYGRAFGSMEGFSYSKALSSSKGQMWDRITINLFLDNPQRYLPGTNMSASPITDAQERRDIVGFLKSVKD